MEYNFSNTETFTDICNAYGVPFTELLRINNISQPLSTPYPKDVDYLDGVLLVPNMIQRIPEVYYERPKFSAPARASVNQAAIGHWSQKRCYLDIHGSNELRVYFPCFPQSYSDTRVANYTSQNPLGRSEPFQIYENSGPRTVSVSFRMHREMLCVTPVDDVVKAVQSATYPIGNDGSIPPRVRLDLGNSCDITGIISGSVEATWSETINKDIQYNVVDLSYTVTECTGNPKTMGGILASTKSLR